MLMPKCFIRQKLQFLATAVKVPTLLNYHIGFGESINGSTEIITPDYASMKRLSLSDNCNINIRLYLLYYLWLAKFWQMDIMIHFGVRYAVVTASILLGNLLFNTLRARSRQMNIMSSIWNRRQKLLQRYCWCKT